jgi:hypothetical protein
LNKYTTNLVGGETDYERNREGPPTVQMEKLTKETKDLNFSNKNLEVNKNKYVNKLIHKQEINISK